MFYIKPQPFHKSLLCINGCLISLFYIKPQRSRLCNTIVLCCLISLFYIKPQHVLIIPDDRFVVLYLCSTSNHNVVVALFDFDALSYISVLHQTTTYSDYFTHIQTVTLYHAYTKWFKTLFYMGKSTKKIPIAMVSVLIFSLLLPIYEQCLNIVYQ